MKDVNYKDEYDKLVKWANTSLNGKVVGIEKLVLTPYSYVLKLNTQKNCFYLKKTPPGLFIEAEVLTILQAECGIISTPEVIAYNKDNNCFILQSCGDETLRTFFSGNLDTKLIIEGVECFKSIQRATVGHKDTFMNKGVNDWRLDKFPELFNILISDKEKLHEWGIHESEIICLTQQSQVLEEVCNALAAYELPDVLNHSDFQDNNMLIDNVSGKVSIIDWGETSIGNPLLPVSTYLNSLKWRYKISEGSEQYKKLQNSFFDGWGLLEHDIQQAVILADKLNQLYYVFTITDLMRRTQHNFPNWNERIKVALTTFIDKIEV